ncbi:MAG TPA: hypothetical protein DCO75_01540 [Fibrobacteres bacterium]|nr:hypothetical protein [Fibrobacterota bacterium]
MVLLAVQFFFWISLVLVVYSYLIYPALLPILSRIFGRSVKKDEFYLPVIAVVVPAYNEEKVIRKKIENILSLDYPSDKCEIWIGSDGSTDSTHKIVESFTDKRIHLWIAPKRGGKTEVLNHMVPGIKTDIVVFTDANTRHHKDCLKKLVRSFADPEVGGVAGLIKHLSNNLELEEKVYRSFEVNQKIHESELHSSISAFGGFYSVRHSLFKPIPYNAYSNDDVLIPMNVIRRRSRMVFEAEAVSEEDMTEKIAHEFTRRIRIGAGNFQAFFWLPDFFNPFKGWPSFCFISHKATRWFSPFFIIVAFICSGILHASIMYALFFLSCLAFIIIGLLYPVLHFRLFRPAFYFLSMNTALVLGFLRFCTGIKSAAWSHTER